MIHVRFSCLFLALTQLLCEAQVITTVAGVNNQGYSGDGGQATSAQILPLIGLAVDAKGNLYIAESGAGVPHVRKVDASGIITTFAGSGSSAGFTGDGGPAINAQLNILAGLAVDQTGDLYIADAGNYRIRKEDTSGIITTVAGNGQIDLGGTGDGGAATSAALQPSGLAFDSVGNLYVADHSAGRIRKIAFGIAPPCLSVSSTLLYFAGKISSSTDSDDFERGCADQLHGRCDNHVGRRVARSEHQRRHTGFDRGER